MHVLTLEGGVQGFRLKSRDFCQPVQGSDLSRLASMHLYGDMGIQISEVLD